MEMIADALLIAGAAGAALYCRVLSHRVAALKNLDSGLGAAIAALARQVDETRATLDSAKSVSGDNVKTLGQLTARAEMAAGRLELLLAALHENGAKRPISVKRDGAAGRVATLGAAAREDAQDADDDDAHGAAALADPVGAAAPFTALQTADASSTPPLFTREALR